MTLSMCTSKLSVICLILLNCAFLIASQDLVNETTPLELQIAIGSAANITCRMSLETFKGKNSTSLYFIEEDSGRRVPQDDVVIKNVDTIVYMIRNASEQNRNYICKSDEDGVGITHVAVGTAPLHVNDFKCYGYDFQYMVCKFTMPNNNIIPIYELNFTAISPNFVQKCHLELNQDQVICNLTESKNYNIYRSNYQYYNFSLRAHNSLGTSLQDFVVNHYSRVVPAIPEYSIRNITVNSVVLEWQMEHYYLYNRKNKLQYEVRLRLHNLEWLNYTHNQYNLTRKISLFTLKLNNLPYPYYEYTVSLRLRVNSTDRNDERMWTPAVIRTFRTVSQRPHKAPKTTTGGFYIDSTETRIRLYWQQLRTYEENGSNFGYVITEVQRDGISVDKITPIEIDRTSALFEWQRRYDYKFIIKSRNDNGTSLESSEIFVPRLENIVLENVAPNWVWTAYQAENHTYTLEWQVPNDSRKLQDYTVFWCTAKMENKNECSDTIEFERVNKNITKYMKTMSKDDQKLNFAVSANYNDSVTKGMYWSTCSADVSSDLTKMTPEIAPVNASSIKLKWTLDICPSILNGYNITYCKVSARESNNYKCAIINGATTKSVEKTAESYILGDLEPYTTYMITMYMYSNMKVSEVSEPQYITTKEAAPTAPRNLTYNNVTSNSVWLTWLAPAETNGKLRAYKINYNDTHHIINCSTSEDPCSTNFTLSNLRSYTDYAVSVTAATVDASSPSDTILFKTLIGKPSKPQHLTISNQYNRQIFEWTKPENSSGRLEFYEVKVTLKNHNESLMEHTSAVFSSMNCVLNLPPCSDIHSNYEIRVRAINAAKRNESYRVTNVSAAYKYDFEVENKDPMSQQNYEDLKCIGTAYEENEHERFAAIYRNRSEYILYDSEWKAGVIYSCSIHNDDNFVYFFTTVSVSFVIIASLLTCVTLIYRKLRKMQDIKVILPAGIENYILRNGEISDEYSQKIQENELQQQQHLLGLCDKDRLKSCEYFRLLSRSSGDSGFTGSTSILQTPQSTIGRSDIYADAMHNADDYIKYDELVNKLKENATATTADSYTAMEKPIVNVTKELNQLPFVVNSYVKPSDIPLCDSGYLSSQLLGKPATNSCGTSFDMLNKSVANIHECQSPSTTSSSPTSTISPICSYVIQKELSALGQQNQFLNS